MERKEGLKLLSEIVSITPEWIMRGGILGDNIHGYLGVQLFADYTEELKRENGGKMPDALPKIRTIYAIGGPVTNDFSEYILRLDGTEEEKEQIRKITQKMLYFSQLGKINDDRILALAKAFDALGIGQNKSTVIALYEQALDDMSHIPGQKMAANAPAKSAPAKSAPAQIIPARAESLPSKTETIKEPQVVSEVQDAEVYQIPGAEKGENKEILLSTEPNGDRKLYYLQANNRVKQLNPANAEDSRIIDDFGDRPGHFNANGYVKAGQRYNFVQTQDNGYITEKEAKFAATGTKILPEQMAFNSSSGNLEITHEEAGEAGKKSAGVISHRAAEREAQVAETSKWTTELQKNRETARQLTAGIETTLKGQKEAEKLEAKRRKDKKKMSLPAKVGMAGGGAAALLGGKMIFSLPASAATLAIITHLIK